MSLPSKVLWSEGLPLDAQHFQQLDRYHEGRLHHVSRALNPDAWGVQAARWNVEGVSRGTLSAESLTLVFGDGEICQAPGTDALPLGVNLADLPAEEHSFVIHAALPVLKGHGGNVCVTDAAADTDDSRYRQLEMETQDLFTDALISRVTYLRKNLTLLSPSAARAGFECIPVVRVCRKADNTFEIDPTFVPPALSLEGAPALQEMLRNLLGKMAAKADALHHVQRQPRGHAIEAQVGDVASFWMLSTILTASAGLSQCGLTAHPRHLFDKLLTLAGALMAFSRKYAVADLPRYDHEDYGQCFQDICAIIRDLLDTVLSSRYVSIPLAKPDGNHPYFTAQLDAAMMESRPRLYLAVNANLPALELVSLLPRQLKVGSPQDVEAMVRTALSGVPLLHMAQVPQEVPVRPDTCYFSIEHRGDRYDAMIKAQTLAVYAPASVPDLRLELFALMD